MIDFQNANFIGLKQVQDASFMPMVTSLLLPDEQVVSVFQAMRGGVVFTDKRIISINAQGMTGKKKDFTSMPYSKIQLFSAETASTFDLETELEFWFAGAGKVKFSFGPKTDIISISKMIAQYALR